MKPLSQARCTVCGLLLTVAVSVGVETLHYCQEHAPNRPPAILPRPEVLPPKDDRPSESSPVTWLFASGPVAPATSSEVLPPGRQIDGNDAAILRWGIIKQYRK